MKIVAVIPAHLQSIRFPNKLLAIFNGKSIIENVIEYVKRLDFVDKIVLASDSAELEEFAIKHKIEWFYMVSGARCGSERSYSYFLSDASFDYYVSIPSDEPFIDSKEVNRVWKAYIESSTRLDKEEISTFYTKFFSREDLESRLSCKIVSNNNDRALYFSRQVIPTTKLKEDHDKTLLSVYKKHIGIFIFPREWMEHSAMFVWNERNSVLANIEGLEQNRFIEFCSSVRLLEIKHIAFGIDSAYQVKVLEDRIKNLKRQI